VFNSHKSDLPLIRT